MILPGTIQKWLWIGCDFSEKEGEIAPILTPLFALNNALVWQFRQQKNPDNSLKSSGFYN
jgi:hypothetical protein